MAKYSTNTIMLSISSTVMIFTIFTIPLMVHSIATQGPKEVEQWIQNLAKPRHAKEKVTKLHFYFHDLLRSGNNSTAAQIAQANMTSTSPTFFGAMNMVDDPLTLEPQLSSKLVGYAKGFYATDSMEELELFVSMAFVFTKGKYKGSSLVVLGNNPELHSYREIPIVGGSGVFRLARGVATFQTYFFNASAGNATVEVDIVALHY